MDVGDLADPTAGRPACAPCCPRPRASGCWAAAAWSSTGEPGVLLVLATGTRGGMHVVTVGPDCGPAGGALLAQVESAELHTSGPQ